MDDRVRELDGLRGLAAVAIVAHHVWPSAVYWGWAAVDLFFVLSGYLITAIVLRHGDRRGFLRAFYLRRGLRIWPIYYLAAAACAPFFMLGLGDVKAVPYYLTYTQEVPRYWNAEMPKWSALSHTWTLALEEQFYLIWPGLLVLLGRRWVIPLALLAAGGSILARAAGVQPVLLAARCDGFALGGLLAALAAERPRWMAPLTGLSAVVSLAIWVVSGGNPLDWSFERPSVPAAFAAFGSFALVGTTLLAGKRAAPFRWAPLVYLGTISYGIYLYHYIIQEFLPLVTAHFGLWHSQTEAVSIVILTLATAAASWRWIEQPILSFKRLVPYPGALVPDTGGRWRPVPQIPAGPGPVVADNKAVSGPPTVVV